MASLKSMMSRSARKAAKHALNVKIFELVESLGPPGEAIAEEKRAEIKQAIKEIQTQLTEIKQAYRDQGDKRMAFEKHIERCLEILNPMVSPTKHKNGRTQPINNDSGYHGRTELLLRIYHSEKRIGTHGGDVQELKKLMDAIEKDDKEINKKFHWDWPGRDREKRNAHERNVKKHMKNNLNPKSNAKTQGKAGALPMFGEVVQVHKGDDNHPMNG